MSRRSGLGYQPTWTDPYRFAALFDAHWGYEIVDGRRRPMHNLKAIRACLSFLEDFKPHGVVLGGDQLDLGAISHHNKKSKLGVEGLRIQGDMDEFSAQVMVPIEEMEPADLWWLDGNHEDWVRQLVDQESGLADTLNIPRMLNLKERGWHYVAQGGHLDVGKLRFVHGDVLGGADAVAKQAILEHNHSIAFGHFHTSQQYVKHSPVDSTAIHIGIAVPALANRGPVYGKRRANKWANGFLFGAIFPDGSFTHYVAHIIDGRFWANGKVYEG